MGFVPFLMAFAAGFLFASFVWIGAFFLFCMDKRRLVVPIGPVKEKEENSTKGNGELNVADC